MISILLLSRFPKDHLKQKEWINRIGRLNWTPKKHSHICSKHFTLNSFVVNDKMKGRRLRDNAVPTLLIPQESEAMAC